MSDTEIADAGARDLIVRVTRRGIDVGTATAIDRARARFREHQGICLPGFIEPALAATLQRVIERSEWHEKIHHGIEPPPTELCIFDSSVYSRFHVLVNDRRLFHVIESITGCSAVGCFVGRVYRMIGGRGHYDTWHDDLDGVRLVAMSVNFSAEPYIGGVLQLRDRHTRQMYWQFQNHGLGDAIIFNLASHLEHCVSAVDGPLGKTAFAGWFRTKPAYEPWFRAGLRRPPLPSPGSGS